MKKFLVIMAMSFLFISNAFASHFLDKKAREVCKINQDIDLNMNWKHDDGSWEVEEFSLKKGDYLKMHKHKKSSAKWYVGSDGAIFPLKNNDWDRVEVGKKYKGVKINDIIGDCKKIKYLNYKSHTANSFNEIFNNKYGSKSVKLSGELYLPGKKGKFPVVYMQHGTAHPKRHIDFFQKVIVEMHKENIGVFIGDSYSNRGIEQKDGWKLGLASRVLDGLNVLNALSKHKNIDENKIGITGYSYGGMVAFYTAYPKLLDLVTKGKQFAAYMPVYPGCDLIFKDMKLVNKPMLMLHAEFDDYAPTIDCINYVKKLKENKNLVELKIYKGAYHGFVSVREKEKEFLSDVGNFRNCKPGHVTDEGYWFYNNKEWKNMTELDAVNAIWKECGQLGVTIGGTVEQQQQAISDTVNFFKKYLK
tara:strand:+ start:505 stop:1755 length:1251 start_codon:yes stop_codon:yes gene_type:complete